MACFRGAFVRTYPQIFAVIAVGREHFLQKDLFSLFMDLSKTITTTTANDIKIMGIFKGLGSSCDIV
jgi:hypothetical protein